MGGEEKGLGKCSGCGKRWERHNKKFVNKVGWSAKKFFKGILNVGAIVCAVIAAIVQPEIAVVAIGAAITCAQSIWDLGETEVKNTVSWYKKKNGKQPTAIDLMYTLEEALANMDFKMRHIKMDDDLKTNLIDIKNVFLNHKVKSKELREERVYYGKRDECTKCTLRECQKTNCEKSFYTTDANNYCKACGGGDQCGEAHGNKHVTLQDYEVKLQKNWNLQQAKRNIQDIFQKLYSAQKGIQYEQEKMQTTLDNTKELLQERAAEAADMKKKLDNIEKLIQDRVDKAIAQMSDK